MSRLLPTAEATARFPDVQLNRTRSSRGQRSATNPKQTLSRHRQCPSEYRLPSASARSRSLRDESGERPGCTVTFRRTRI
jgi:hypothetical protein